MNFNNNNDLFQMKNNGNNDGNEELTNEYLPLNDYMDDEWENWEDMTPVSNKNQIQNENENKQQQSN